LADTKTDFCTEKQLQI